MKPNLNEEFFDEYKDIIGWHRLWGDVFHRHQVSERIWSEFADTFQDIDWYYLSKNQEISMEFIDRYQSKIDWRGLSKNLHLTEEVIKKYKDKFDWELLSENELGYPTIMNNLERIDFNRLSIETNKKLTDDQKAEMKKIIDMKLVFSN